MKGEKIFIQRIEERRGKFWGIKKERLTASMYKRQDGAQIAKAVVSRIRTDLHLDEENGVDSDAFYHNEPTTPSDFIITYRKLIKKLSKY